MKKLILIMTMIVMSLSSFAQVGIGTTSPASTLDVTGVPGTASSLDGIIAPRLTGAELRSKSYTAAQTAAMVYVTLADPIPAGQTVNVSAVGYYYFNGTVWIEASGATLTGGNLINITGTTINKINNIQFVTVAANVTVDANNSPEGIFRYDMAALSTFTIDAFSNPVDGGVYNFHFVNSTGGTVTLPSNFVNEDGTALNSLAVPAGEILSFYHYQGTNFTMEQ
jgi:hypothetical protein